MNEQMHYENIEYHPLANLFPLMQGDEYESLKADIKQNGLREPICMYDNMILDGRNRFNACMDLNIQPVFKQFTGTDPVAFVISLNIHRRHLNESQRAVIAGKLANMRQGERTDIEPSANLRKVSQEEAARMLNVSPRTVATVKAIERDAPELIEKIERGEMTANQAHTEVRRAEVIDKLENIEMQEAKAASGIYDVIVIDPPWDMQKIERDVAPNQVEFDYPTMSDEEIQNIKLPTADDCHVWLWTTHKKLPLAFELLNKWGLKYVCAFTWHKNGGFQPFGLPQYNCEFALYARKGTPIFIETKDFMVCFNAPRKGHSEKPDEFYNVIKRVTGGRRLDMFNRRKIDGFDGWGNEAI